MKRAVLSCLFFLLIAPSAFAQSTTVSGTISDVPDGQLWFGGTYSFVFRVSPSNPTAQYFWNGVPFSSAQTIAGSLDGSAHYSVSIPSNTSITPAGSTWDLTVCPLATSSCLTVQSITITGATQTVAPIPLSIRINLSAPPLNPRAYTDTEVVSGSLGQQYFNVSIPATRVCSAIPCGWTSIGGGGSATAPFTSLSSPFASTGTVRLANNETGICWRNFNNTGDVCLTLNASNALTNLASLPANSLQKYGTGGVLAPTNCLENSTTLNCLDDPHFRGPNLGVDVTVSPFLARAINPNAIPATNCTITGGTNSAVCTSVTGLQVADGYAITNAGPSQTMTTPAAPTVTPSCAAGPTGLGFTVPAGAGSTPYAYSGALRDQGQGLTAASPNGTTATGNATLGGKSTNIVTTTTGIANTFTTTVGSSADMAPGCMVVFKGSTDDAEFGGWKIITSVPDATHVTWVSGINAAIGISTNTATGGNMFYWLGNHLVLPTPGAGGTQYAIYGRTAGSMAFLQMSLLANLGYTDPTYNTFDDYGSPMMDSGPRPWFVPTTPPVSATNDTFTSTIATIVGNTLTFAGNAPNTATAKASQFDNAPNIAAALTATNSTSVTGAGGTIRFPVVVENSGTGNYCFVTSTYIVATVNAVIQDGAVCLGDTFQLTGNWYGTDNSAARLVQPPNSQRPHIPILIQGANPGIFVKSGGGLNKVSVSMTGNGGVGVFNAQMNNAQVFEDDNFSTGITNDYMSIAFYDYQSSVSGGFGGKMRNTSWAGGPDNVTVGRTATPIFATKFSLEWDFDYVSCYARGYSFVPFNAGLFGNFHMGEECQGNIMPIVMVTPATVGTTSGSFKISQAVSDTGPAPLVANLGPLNAFTNADITIEGGNLPSAGQPLISGSPFLGSVFLSGLSPVAQIGQNINLTVIGRNGNFASQLRTPSVRLAAINYITNHTLAANEGIVNAQATLTFTIDTALGDGQGWDVYSEIGTTTLTVSAGVLHGNAATGPITIPNNSGMHVFLKGGNAYAYGLGGGGAGASPGGTTGALQYNGGGGSFGAFNSPVLAGNYVCGYSLPTNAAGTPTCPLPGVPLNPQVGTTYTIGAANYWNDRGTVITATNSAAQTYTAVNPSTNGFGFNMPYVLWNRGTASGLLTETTSGFKMNNVLNASLSIPINWLAHHWSDGVDLYAAVVPTISAFPACLDAGGNHYNNDANGNIVCGTSASGNGLSGMTAGQIPVAATATSVTSSKALAGSGTGIVTGPVTSVSTDLVNYTGTAGQTADSGVLLANVWRKEVANISAAVNHDFSAGTWKIPTAAGFTAGATSMFGYDSTNKNPHCYDNNADAICAGFASAPANNSIVMASVTSGNVLLAPATQTNINAIGYAAGGGTANAQTVTLSPAIAAYTNGFQGCWKPAAANSTTTPTVAFNGLAATTITKSGGVALAASDLTTTAVACVIYDGTNMELQNPQTASGSGGGGTIAGSGLTAGNAYYNIGGTLTPANAYGIPSALTVTFTNGSANIASVGNTLIVGAAVQFQTTGSLPTNFSTATTYYVITTGSPFTVSATYGGSAVSAGSAGSGTQTLTIVPTLVTNPAYCVASSATVCVFSGPVTGLSGFTAGQAVYVSDATSGALTNTNPASGAGSSGHFVQRIGVATSTTAILVTISPDVATVQ